MAKNKNFQADKYGNNSDLLSRCSVCGSDLRHGDTVILEDQDQKTTFHVTCSKCSASSIVFLSNSQAGMVSLGLATDLDSEEVKAKFFTSSVSSDDVINVYQFLSGYEGEFSGLIKK